jgi:hypothetical protein
LETEGSGNLDIKAFGHGVIRCEVWERTLDLAMLACPDRVRGRLFPEML